MKLEMKADKVGGIIRSGALIVPLVCAATLPIVKISNFFESAWRILFFDFVMVPLGNIALLGMTANGDDGSFGLIALLIFTGVMAPIMVALLFARYWRRWQFVLVWIGYLALVAWDTIVATFLVAITVKGGALR